MGSPEHPAKRAFVQAVPSSSQEHDTFVTQEVGAADSLGTDESKPHWAELPAIAERFIYRSWLGAGAMGTVISAYDTVRRHEVALKCLHKVDPDALYRFKQEFRLLAGLIHPNVVTLYELSASDERWTVAMELVNGARSFLEYVRPYQHLLDRTFNPESIPEARSKGSSGSSVDPRSDHESSTRDHRRPGPKQDTLHTTINLNELSSDDENRLMPPAVPISPRRACIMDASLSMVRLQSALLQLVTALEMVHQQGMLHRDIKPSNVLVDHTGRVVVCDFGLVMEVSSYESSVAGTPAYMSPEQSAHEALTPASDFYSVGVMLYEALTGELPISATSVERLLHHKHHASVRSPRELNPSISRDLELICLGLLDPDPQRRPDAVTIREVFRELPSAIVFSPASDPDLFVGRADEYTHLMEAFALSRKSGSVGVLVSGPSGVGKSTLVAKICRDLQEQHNALVFSGRCYQTESVPFKAVDAVVDSIADHLSKLPTEEAAELLGDLDDEVAALCKLFPVLCRANAVVQAVERHKHRHPTLRAASLAHVTLQSIVMAMARRRPIVVAIDDLQWGDLDSEPFLRELIEGTGSPGVFVLATCRDEIQPPLIEAPPTLVEALGHRGAGESNGFRELSRLELKPLVRADAARMIKAIAGPRCPRADALERLIDEAGGNPMFVSELAYAAATGEQAAAGEGLDALIGRRIAALPAECRALLEATATAAWPQPLAWISGALGLQHEAEALARLLAARMVRLLHGAEGELLTTYHDRVRHVAMAGLSDHQRQGLHRTLAHVFEQAPETDIEALALHWHGAGDIERATDYAVRAGDQAIEVRAYRRAAEHYARALRLGALDEALHHGVGRKRADALALAGCPRDAAEAYLALVEGDCAEGATDARDRALLCLLRAGETDRATSLIDDAGRLIGIKIPRSKPAALVSIARGRLRVALRLRWLLHHMRLQERNSPSVVRRLDITKQVAGALITIEPIIGFAVQTRYLHEALRIGTPTHVACALGYEAVFTAMRTGHRARSDIQKLLRQAARAAKLSHRDGDLAFVEGMRGTCEYLMMSRMRDAAARLDTALSRVSNEPRFVWDADSMLRCTIEAHALAGSFAYLSVHLPMLLKKLRESGNEYMYNNLSRSEGISIHMAQDRPERARQLLIRAKPAENEDLTFDNWDFRHRISEISAYVGQWGPAHEQSERLWSLSKKALLTNVPSIVCTTASALGRMSVAMVARSPWERRRYLACAREMKVRIERLRGKLSLYAHGHASLVGALIFVAEADLDSAVAQLRLADDCFTQCQAGLTGMPVRYQLGRLIGGDEGRSLMDDAQARMKAEGVVNLERYVHWRCPIET